MSAATAEKSDDAMMFCASCGTAGGGDIKLMKCTACHLVRYCSIKCQKEHRPKHKKACKKRAAELRDELLFKQPESTHLGDCPICCLPLPLDITKSTMMTCCVQLICDGCDYAITEREILGSLEHNCPFCRKVVPKTEDEINERLMKRIEANDPVAMRFMGTKKYHAGDYKAAFDYWTKGAALGDLASHYELSVMYMGGQGVEKDEKKEQHHAEQAAIGGHYDARHNLGCEERGNGRMDRAAKHWIIAAKLGYDVSMENINGLYKAGFVSKEDFAAALRGHKAADDATKSPQREKAAAFFKWQEDRERKRP